MTRQSAVQFAGSSRIHVALAVTDVERATLFYSSLFGIGPTKVRSGYAKFEAAEPPVNLTLNEHPAGGPAAAGPQHFGIQVKDTDAVDAARARLEAAGIATETEDEVICCFAKQTKVWSSDPDGHRWEVFVVLEADEAVHSDAPRTDCCTPECCT